MNIWNSYKFDLIDNERSIETFLKILPIFDIEDTLEFTFETETIEELQRLKYLIPTIETPIEVVGIHKSNNLLPLVRWCDQHIPSSFSPRTNLTLNFFIVNKNYAFSIGFLNNNYWQPSIYLSFIEYGERQRFRNIRTLSQPEFEAALKRLNLSFNFYQDIININNETILKYYQKCLMALDIKLDLTIDAENRLKINTPISPTFKVKTLGFSSLHLIPIF